MRLISRKTLLEAAKKHPAAQSGLLTLAGIIKVASWASMDDIVNHVPGKPSPVDNERVVINIGGNKYRVILAVDFARETVYVKWFGTHAEYDKIDAATATLSDM